MRDLYVIYNLIPNENSLKKLNVVLFDLTPVLMQQVNLAKSMA